MKNAHEVAHQKKKQYETPHPQPPKKKKTDKQKQDLVRIQKDILIQINVIISSFCNLKLYIKNKLINQVVNNIQFE